MFLAAVTAPAVPASTGSTLWQLLFISFGCVLILFEVLRGWRRGVARQLARLGALIAAYFAAYFLSDLLAPLARPFLHMPDAVLSLVVGAILALLVYGTINALGTMFFKRTGQHESALVRTFYGATGAVLGLFFGLFLVWLAIVTVRSLGSVADAQVRQWPATRAVPARARPLHAVDLRNGSLDEPGESTPLLASLARMKNSLELGSIGSAVKRADVIPGSAYDTLGKIGKVFSDPESAQRFLSFPGARELGEDSKIAALRNDQEISDLIAQGRFLDLLQNEKIRDVANDQAVVEKVKHFDLQAALDYALKRD
ncbi:MAG TPA: CvpA family protein [Chthoniobacterales bacterium]|jgi:uncharacterized membrane protein required for colicin V production